MLGTCTGLAVLSPLSTCPSSSQPTPYPPQLLMTKLRNGAISGAEFRFYADRLLNFLAEVSVGWRWLAGWLGARVLALQFHVAPVLPFLPPTPLPVV